MQQAERFPPFARGWVMGMRALFLLDREGNNKVRKGRKERIYRPDPIVLGKLSALAGVCFSP